MDEGTDPGQQHKGAQCSCSATPTCDQPGPRRPGHTYDLNVEVGSDGSVQVIPPLTNAPATTNSSAP